MNDQERADAMELARDIVGSPLLGIRSDAEAHMLGRLAAALLATNEELEHARFFMEAANTPLMRDVIQERDSAQAEVAQLKAELERVRAENQSLRMRRPDSAQLVAAEEKYRRTRHALEQVQDDSNVGYLSVAAQHLVAAALSEAPATEQGTTLIEALKASVDPAEAPAQEEDR